MCNPRDARISQVLQRSREHGSALQTVAVTSTDHARALLCASLPRTAVNVKLAGRLMTTRTGQNQTKQVPNGGKAHEIVSEDSRSDVVV